MTPTKSPYRQIKRRLALPLLTLLLSTSTMGQQAQNNYDHSLTVDDSSTTIFGYQDLLRLLRSRSITSIEDLLPLLPETYRAHYTLVFNSRSSQGATPTHPRIIVFGPNANLVMAFTATAAQTGGRKIEIIEWDPSQKRFLMHEIEFRAGRRPLVNQAPTDCARCHREPARPNWDGYPLWPGIYGSEEASPAVLSAEDRNYQQVMEQRLSQPRLRYFPSVALKRITGETYVNDMAFTNGHFTQLLSNRNLQRLAQDITAHPSYQHFKYALTAAALPCFDQSSGLSPEDFLPPNIRNLDRLAINYQQTFQIIDRSVRSFYASRVREVTRSHPVQRGTLGNTAQIPVLSTFQYFLSRMGMDLDEYSLSFDRGTFSFGTPGGGFSDLQAFWLQKQHQSRDRDLEFLTSQLTQADPLDAIPQRASSPRMRIRGMTPLGTIEPHIAQLCRSLQQRSLAALNSAPVEVLRQNLSARNPVLNPNTVPDTDRERNQHGQQQEPVMATTNGDIPELLVRRCGSCHCQDCASPAGGFALRTSALRQYIQTHSVESVRQRLLDNDPQRRMPPNLPLLPALERQTVMQYLESLQSSPR